MKVSVCTGSKCSFYGSDHIIFCLEDLKEYLHNLDGIPEEAELEIELLPCQGFCKKGNHGVAPVVYVDGELVERAQSQQIMEMVLNRFEEGAL